MSTFAPCRCCGETEHLELHDGYDEDWTFTPDGQVQRDKTGAFAVSMIDHVRCSICSTQAPVATWEGPSASFSRHWKIRRNTTVQAWGNHEDAERIVLQHVEANSGEKLGLLDRWPFKSTTPAEVLADIERANGLPSSGADPSSIEGIVNALAGRVIQTPDQRASA